MQGISRLQYISHHKYIITRHGHVRWDHTCSAYLFLPSSVNRTCLCTSPALLSYELAISRCKCVNAIPLTVRSYVHVELGIHNYTMYTMSCTCRYLSMCKHDSMLTRTLQNTHMYTYLCVWVCLHTLIEDAIHIASLLRLTAKVEKGYVIGDSFWRIIKLWGTCRKKMLP